MSAMAVLAREEIKQRREGRRFTTTTTTASRTLVERARAADEALARGFAARCRQETSADEDERLERDEAACWEALYVAAVAFDTLVDNPASPFADRVLFFAQAHGPHESGWLHNPCRGADGVTHPAYWQDGYGRVIAVLTDDGRVVATGWQCQREPLPRAP
jgi:hypothetical protein